MLIVTCTGGCHDDGGRARVWRETCSECADSIAEAHRVGTGHPVDVERVTTLKELLADPAIRNMFRRRGA